MRPRRRRSGQAMTEFALVAPILFLLLFGVLQTGLLMGSQNGLVNGVRDATRRAATYRINADSFSLTIFSSICSSIGTSLSDHLRTSIPAFNAALLTKTISYEWKTAPTPSVGGATEYFLVAHITATYAHPMFIPLIGNLIGGSGGTLPLSASEQMRVENPGLTTTSGDETCP